LRDGPLTRRGGIVVDALFAFLFKYRPVVFARGDFVLGAPWSWTLGVVALLAMAALWSYAGVRGKTRPLDRLVLGGFRLAVLALLGFALLRPALAVSSVVPRQNFLGVLIDDSRSMRIADEAGRARSAFVAQSFGNEKSALRRALEQRFQLRFFRFATSAERLEAMDQLGYAGTETHIGTALQRARQDLTGVPVAGLILVTDGADNSGETLNGPLLALRSAGVPVYTIGVGRRVMEPDIELSRVATPSSVLKGTSLAVDLMVTQHGFRGRRVPLFVEDEGRIVAEQQVELPADGEAAPVRVRFTADRAGPRRIVFRIPAQPGEVVLRNNEQEALVQVVDQREKILYIEGEPRFEMKFIRHALAGDPNVQLIVLQRTARNKFLRLDVDRGDELATGFPRTREELFGYQGLIVGSIEASFFTYDQLRMIADFVSVRGGGLLMLGGRHAFAQGGYAGTAVADVLPVVLDTADTAGDFFAAMKVEPTRAGRSDAMLQLVPTEQASLAHWDSLPPLTTVNPIYRVKPGATAWLVGRGDSLPREEVVLASQRYGRGKAFAFTAQDSWLWRMSAAVPLSDRSHQTFWRQLVRGLVDGVPGAVEASVSRDHVEPGQPVVLTADVVDSSYLAVNNARVMARVRGPDGGMDSVRLEWDVETDGSYRARYVPRVAGRYEVDVEARRGAMVLGSDVASLDAAPSQAEYFDAGMREQLLQRIAGETGGRFYTPADVASLPDDLRYTGGGVTAVEEKDLWDMPIVFLLLVGLLGGEWGWRRARGLA
jgi:uncharacterized membrane protein